MIQLIGITKSYPYGQNSFNHVLCGVNMNIEKGDFVAIKGASGSGKTTLLSILGTLLQPDKGVYNLDNQIIDMCNRDCAAIRNQKIGFVFQDHRLLPQLTALENILLPTLAYQTRSNDLQIQYAEQLMAFVGITAIANQYPENLSGGEACRTALCRALIMNPLLVLADEPTGQLDAENARDAALLLKKLNNEFGTTVVMVTHSDETAAFANRILTLKDGILS